MIPRKTREAAILALDILASEVLGADNVEYDDVLDVLEEGLDRDAVKQLGTEAFFKAPTRDNLGVGIPWEAQYAEAAGLLRDGWSPGDPVEVL